MGLMTTTEPAPLSSPLLEVQRPRISGRAWAILWGVTLLLQVVLLVNHAALDTFLWRTTRWAYGDNVTKEYRWETYKAAHAGDPDPKPFYVVKNPPLTRTLADGRMEARLFDRTTVWWRIFKDFAENLTIVLLIVAVSLVTRRRWKAGVMMIAGEAAAGIVSTLIRIIAGRYRPNAPPGDGVNHWQFFRGVYEGSNLSWPSGHATAAFASAAILTYLTPLPARRQARWLYLFIAAGTAYARVVQQDHYYADVIMGAAVGWTSAWLVCQGLDGLIEDPLPAGTAAAA